MSKILITVTFSILLLGSSCLCVLPIPGSPLTVGCLPPGFTLLYTPQPGEEPEEDQSKEYTVPINKETKDENSKKRMGIFKY